MAKQLTLRFCSRWLWSKMPDSLSFARVRVVLIGPYFFWSKEPYFTPKEPNLLGGGGRRCQIRSHLRGYVSIGSCVFRSKEPYFALKEPYVTPHSPIYYQTSPVRLFCVAVSTYIRLFSLDVLYGCFHTY